MHATRTLSARILSLLRLLLWRNGTGSCIISNIFHRVDVRQALLIVLTVLVAGIITLPKSFIFDMVRNVNCIAPWLRNQRRMLLVLIYSWMLNLPWVYPVSYAALTFSNGINGWFGTHWGLRKWCLHLPFFEAAWLGLLLVVIWFWESLRKLS